MKLSKILIIGTVAACFSISSSFAVPSASVPNNSTITQQKNETAERKNESKEFKFNKNRCFRQGDPIKALESKKERIQSRLKEGKITKEEASEKIIKIDERIKKIKEFNSLPLQQKKDKLLENFKARVESKVKDGNLTQEKANELIKKYSEDVQKWDGNGFLPIPKKGLKK